MAILSILFTTLFLIWLVATMAACRRPMPKGLSVASPLLPADELTFFTDLTYVKDGKQICEQHILPEIERLISEAHAFVIIDIFLYNDLYESSSTFPELCKRLTQALLAAKKKRPSLKLWIISDPTNTGYGSYANPYFDELTTAGATVVLTNLDRLPDSHLPYAGFWNLLGRHFSSGGKGWLPSPFHRKAPPFSLGSWLALLNFKANHRKVVLTEKAGLITSANNCHDASASNSNIAFSFSGPLLHELLKSEEAVLALSGIRMDLALPRPPSPNNDDLQIQLLTEGKIKEVLLDELQKCQAPATLWMAMFYLADRHILAALVKAARQGMTINLILDGNHDAFGHKKNGVPNRPVAALLKKKSAGRIHIRWYASHGEQFHTKLILLADASRTMIMGGSANLTRRNIADFNLETCLRIITPSAHPLSEQVLSYLNRLWDNKDGDFTAAYEDFADPSILKYWQYQIQERSGACLF